VTSKNPENLEQTRVLVIDFGAQYAQLIARRVREAGVFSEIVAHQLPLSQILAKQPSAIILSGGPASVYEAGAPTIDRELFNSGVPIFGICYGFQLQAQSLGGVVSKTGLSEFGRTALTRKVHLSYLMKHHNHLMFG
jgi:GMP synthase (glutamine-hydrolysing)